jgi:hypothetical protein
VNRIGISFKSPLTPDEVRTRFIEPLRDRLETEHAGIYSNYLRQADADPSAPAEHLLVFHVREFQDGLRLLRVALEKIGVPGEATFHNLDPSEPLY